MSLRSRQNPVELKGSHGDSVRYWNWDERLDQWCLLARDSLLELQGLLDIVALSADVDGAGGGHCYAEMAAHERIWSFSSRILSSCWLCFDLGSGSTEYLSRGYRSGLCVGDMLRKLSRLQ